VTAPGDHETTVRVIRSTKRKRGVSARMVEGVMELRIPSWMSKADEAKWVAEMQGRFARKGASDQTDLVARSTDLARRFDLPKPKTIRWVTNQQSRWGSCTPADGSIRISDRLAGMPSWVLDYVLVHEMSHLRHANHGRAFWTLVNRYPRTERARGYLMAKGIGEGAGDDAD
jgi:Protein of unknown function DUF45